MKTSNSYPRSLPFSAPQASEAKPRPFSWLHYAVLPLVFLGLGLGLAYFLFGKNTPALAVAAKDPTVPTAELESEKRPEEKKPAPEVAVPDSKKETAPAIKPEDPAKKSPAVSAKTDGKTREQLLEALGGMCAVHLYQSYLNIGLLADAVENEAYSGSDATGILLTIQELVTMVENHVTVVSRLDLETDDLHTLTRIRLVSNLLRTQSAALMGYWATADEEYASRYQTAREVTWGELQEMLGLKGD